MIILTKLLLFSTGFINLIECSNMLIIAPIKSYSHVVALIELAEALAKRGHNVTMISAHQLDDKINSFRKIIVNVPIINSDADNSRPPSEIFRVAKIMYIKRVFDFGTDATETVLNDPKVKELIRNPNEHFDIVIMEHFITYAMHGFCYHFKAHCIIYTPIRLNSIIKPLIGFIPPLSYSPDSIMGYNRNLSFFDRLHILGLYLYTQFLLYYSYIPLHDELLKRHFKDAPNIHDVMYNISLVLQNSHISINYPAPEPPNVIEIGGFHLKHDHNCSEEIKEFLDSSKQDVVYFSMGSVMESKQLSNDSINALLRAFSKLRGVSFLWKYEAKHLKDKPDNVKIISWAPQKYILAHPNVKLFISHGGGFSIMESVYFGKPVMGIPIFGDQVSNMMFLESVGMGKYINFDHITEDVVVSCVEDILKNSSFSEKAQKNSKLLRDQPMHPMDKAIYWIEFVQRHEGGSRLALEGLNLPAYKQLLLDVFSFILCVIVLIVLLFVKTISFVKYRLKTISKKIMIEKVKCAATKQKKDY